MTPSSNWNAHVDERFRITAVEAAGCMDHADVVLAGASAEHEQRVRIEAGAARAVLAELGGVPNEFACFVDLLSAALAAFDCRISHVEVSGEQNARGCVLFEGQGAPAGIRGLPAAVALLIAARLGLGVAVAGERGPTQSTPGALPLAIEQFLAQLPLNGVGDGER
jgi:hypothetical protein